MSNKGRDCRRDLERNGGKGFLRGLEEEEDLLRKKGKRRPINWSEVVLRRNEGMKLNSLKG